MGTSGRGPGYEGGGNDHCSMFISPEPRMILPVSILAFNFAMWLSDPLPADY